MQPDAAIQAREVYADRRCARDAWTIPLPPRLRSDDARLKIAATNLLALNGVRSVVVNRDRTVATVVFRPDRASMPEIAEIPTTVFADPVAEGDATCRELGIGADSVVSWTDPQNRSTCFIRVPAGASGPRRVLLLVAAAGMLALGLAGIVLPGLPTTPFVLVASYCLLRSSPTLHAKLLHSRLFGGLLRDWHLHRGLRPHVRYKAIAVVAIVLGASLLLTNLPVAAKLAILAIAAIGVVVVWRLPNVTEQESGGKP